MKHQILIAISPSLHLSISLSFSLIFVCIYIYTCIYKVLILTIKGMQPEFIELFSISGV